MGNAIAGHDELQQGGKKAFDSPEVFFRSPRALVRGGWTVYPPLKRWAIFGAIWPFGEEISLLCT